MKEESTSVEGQISLSLRIDIYRTHRPERGYSQYVPHVLLPLAVSFSGSKTLTVSFKEENMSNKIYVGGLPYSVTDGQLQEVFSAHGTVESARVISDKFTGQSRGFGFVEMSSGGEAQTAIQALNGSQMDGRTLVVNEAKPMVRRDNGGDSGGRDNRTGGRNRW